MRTLLHLNALIIIHLQFKKLAPKHYLVLEGQKTFRFDRFTAFADN